jgi:DNA gyrase subunit B
MRELIELGYVYIAQPPLYKIRKGKQEQYLKDEDELFRYQTQNALDDASLHVNADAPEISGQALEELVNDYRKVNSIIRRLSRHYSEDLLQAIKEMPVWTPEHSGNESKAQQWTDLLQESVAAHTRSGAIYTFKVKYDDEDKVWLPRVTSTIHGVRRKVTLSPEFFRSAEYIEIQNLGQKLNGMIEEGAYVKRGDKTQEVSNFDEALTWLMEDAMKGHYLQRYKGLGEMNPGQLWETTMDPENRRMLKVTIEDAMSADRLFSTLMGDQVEPRRDFIETNALSVSNLDV